MSGWRERELRQELLRRREADQAVRAAAKQQVRGEADDAMRVDRDNSAWLAHVLGVQGWPGWHLVGEDGATAAWLLAQHADEQPDLQRRCLRLLRRAVSNGDAPRWQWAYLLDRVLLAENRPQLFGTQVTVRAGDYQPRPLRDPGGVDARRAAVGLQPLADYLARMRADHPPTQPTLSCPECGTPVHFDLPEPRHRVTLHCTVVVPSP